MMPTCSEPRGVVSSAATRRRKRGQGGRTGDAELQRLAAVHELVQPDALEEAGLPQLLCRCDLLAVEELHVRLQHGEALLQADVRLLRPQRCLCGAMCQEHWLPATREGDAPR